MAFLSAFLAQGLVVALFIIRGLVAVGVGLLVAYGLVFVVARAIADARRPDGLARATAREIRRTYHDQRLDITPAMRRGR